MALPEVVLDTTAFAMADGRCVFSSDTCLRATRVADHVVMAIPQFRPFRRTDRDGAPLASVNKAPVRQVDLAPGTARYTSIKGLRSGPREAECSQIKNPTGAVTFHQLVAWSDCCVPERAQHLAGRCIFKVKSLGQELQCPGWPSLSLGQ